MSRKLLLADASTAIQRVVALTFAGEDVQVVAVSDGEQAIQRIPVERPDIVLANIGTAKRSGYDVAAFVKTHPDLSHIPVLLLAGAFEPVDEERARQVKSAGVLVKPFDTQQVVARVRDLVPSRTPQSPVVSAVGAAASPAAAHAEPSATPPGAPILEPEPRVSNPESRIPSPASRVPDPRSPVPDPQSRALAPGAGRTGSLDDYFDRLDAALASRSASRGPLVPTPSAADAADISGSVPSMTDVLKSQPPPSLAVEITDELVDRIAQRVIERLNKGQGPRPKG